jgi:hypothetical protein
MIVGEDGRVSGSVNRAQVAELLKNTDDPELQAHYREVLGESDEGKEYDESAGDTKAEADEASEGDEDLDALRAEYETATGQKADGRWGAERLRSEIDAAGGGEQ